MSRILGTIAALLTIWSVAVAQTDRVATFESQIAETTEELGAISDLLDEEQALPDDVEATLRAMLDGSRSRLTPVESLLKDAEDRLDLLPAAPKEGQPPEAESISTRRATLLARISRLEAARSNVVSNIDEASALLTSISAARVKTLYGELTSRGESLLAPAFWVRALAQGQEFADKVGDYFTVWTIGRANHGGLTPSLLILLAGFIASVLLVGPVHQWMRTSFSRALDASEPTDGKRVAAAGVKMIARLVSGGIAGLFIVETSRATGLLTVEGVPVVRALWFALIAFLLVEGFTSGLFAPSAPNWRLADLDVVTGQRARFFILSIVVIFGVQSFVVEAIKVGGGLDDLARLIQGLSAVLIGALLYLVCRRQVWEQAQELNEKNPQKPKRRSRWRLLRRLGRVVGLVIIAGALVGYIKFSTFAASRLFLLAIILSVAWFARASAREAAAWIARRLSSKQEQEEDDEREIFRFWVGAGIDAVLLLALTPVALVLAGVGWESVRDVTMRAFFGFQLGGVTISISDILIAIAVFVGVLVLTRLIQRGLEKGPFAHSRIDVGVQNSLTTLVGYAGLMVAFLAALTMTPINLSSLAIIAGALSVGIGFGLQSIVNNFVSGLILLFERPIKVGDWIVTASGEGTVKNISVRSTEIETFNRSSIIVPNSELISSTVTNWTHKDKIGRIIVNVGVSYGADPEHVVQILKRCASEHALVVRYPEPYVVWQNFGASSLDFELRAYLGDISTGLQTRSELRFAIFKAFKEEGIEIPFPQPRCSYQVSARYLWKRFGRKEKRCLNSAPIANAAIRICRQRRMRAFARLNVRFALSAWMRY